MKKVIKTEDKIYFTEKCPYCDKVIQGTKMSQVKYNIQVHILTKHQEKIQWKDIFRGEIGKDSKKPFIKVKEGKKE